MAHDESWWTRNWKWVVPVGCVGLLVLIAGFIAATLFTVTSFMRSSEVYTEGLAMAVANPEVQRELGEPIEPGWMASGSIEVTGASGDAELAIPVSGPENRGRIYVIAEKRAGRWIFELAEVEIDGRDERIDLLSGPGSSHEGGSRKVRMRHLAIKRVYEEAVATDGFRVLVDRVWPRGMTKERARVDLWLRSVAPSTQLRKWFDHDPAKWVDFKRRYFAELDEGPEGLAELLARASREAVTLVYSASDEVHNQAAALEEYLFERGGRP